MKYAIIALRWFLGLVFIAYGVQKLLGGQFIFDHRGVTLNLDTVAAPTLVWFFFGYSQLYGSFIGLGECVAGALVLWRRTETIGALCYFPIALNVAVLDVCFGFPLPATLLAVTLALGSGLLLWKSAAGYSRSSCRRPRQPLSRAIN